MTTLKKQLPLLNTILAVLCLLMLILQFLPFWNDGETVCSMQEMLWFPNDQNGIPGYISEQTGVSFNIDSVVWLTLVTFITSIFGAIFSLTKNASGWPAVFPAVGGFCAVWNYLSRAALQLGNIWGLHLAVGICQCLLGVSVLLLSYLNARKEC